MDSRVSATGLKSVELDELTTNQIIINNEGLQYFHKYNIFLPTVTEGYYNLQEELDNIMISNTTQDLELIQLETRMGAAEGSITTLGAGLLLTSGGVLLALDLVNQKSWILFFQKPLRSDISSNVYLDFDTNYFKIDTSNNLTLSDTFWKKDISNNLSFTSGKIGIGVTSPGANYSLDVLNNINCAEIYRNGTPLSSTLSLFLPLTGGTLTGVLSGTTISATNMTASLFTGSGASLNSLNASNVSSGTLSITRGGIGTTTLTANQILIGNSTTSILQSPNLTWDNTTNTLSATNFVGSGAGLTSLNTSNVTLGTLSISRGGIGTTTLTSNQVLIGNAATSILQSPNLAWNNTSNTLSVSNLQLAGQITGVTTISGSTGLFGTVTTNNTNVAIPSVGVAGGTGDKLILAAGTATVYPYSLGINTNELWHSVPSGASHKFYNNGVNTLTIDSSGNVGIGTTPDVTYRLNVSDYVKLKYLYIFNPDGRITHLPFGGNNQNYIRGKLNIDGTSDGLAVAGPTTLSGATTVTGAATLSGGLTVNSVSCTGAITASGNITATGNMYAANFGIGIPFTPNCRLDVQGIANIRGSNPVAVPSNFMASGSLTLGSSDVNYGNSTGWSSSTAGLLLECADITEICVHDSNTRVVSLLYYVGPDNRIYIGRDKGWGVTGVTLGGLATFLNGFISYANSTVYGSLTCTMTSVANSGTDYVGVQINTSQGSAYNTTLYIMYGSFTGFHRCFSSDIEFKDNQQLFKDSFYGRIVISTGKIATDKRKVDDNEWTVLYDKEGITIEDALPIVELSRKKKDKRVFGVYGLLNRSNSREDRLIVNSVGEGGIWVINSNGNIENGDYITSSDYLGYGEKQDDDILHNYTVAKATMDCDFELESNLYNCLEIENGLKIAFIACTYHCG